MGDTAGSPSKRSPMELPPPCPKSFATAEEAYADACSLPLTILADVRESPTTRQVSYEEAVALLRKDDDLFESPTRAARLAGDCGGASRRTGRDLCTS
jgi:hypothetical protein